jgi:LPS-assembly lipoprotein
MSLFKLTTIMAVLVVLQGCGFRSLYGDPSAGGSSAEFSLIKVEPIKDRIGQRLRNHLRTALNPKPRTQKPRYLLKTKVTQSTSSLAVRKSAFATRANLKVTANFELLNAATAKPIFSAKRSATVSYNILDSEYATLAAEKDARIRAVRELSEDIRIQLGVYFSDLPN